MIYGSASVPFIGSGPERSKRMAELRETAGQRVQDRQVLCDWMLEVGIPEGDVAGFQLTGQCLEYGHLPNAGGVRAIRAAWFHVVAFGGVGRSLLEHVCDVDSAVWLWFNQFCEEPDGDTNRDHMDLVPNRWRLRRTRRLSPRAIYTHRWCYEEQGRHYPRKNARLLLREPNRKYLFKPPQSRVRWTQLAQRGPMGEIQRWGLSPPQEHWDFARDWMLSELRRFGLLE